MQRNEPSLCHYSVEHLNFSVPQRGHGSHGQWLATAASLKDTRPRPKTVRDVPKPLSLTFPHLSDLVVSTWKIAESLWVTHLKALSSWTPQFPTSRSSSTGRKLWTNWISGAFQHSVCSWLIRCAVFLLPDLACQPLPWAQNQSHLTLRKRCNASSLCGVQIQNSNSRL